MTTWTSTGTSSATACPVTSSTRVSAISWPLPRSSPAALADKAARVSAAWTATACATGSRAETSAIESGTGRIVTRRSVSAMRHRSTAAAASRRSAQALTRRSSSRSPQDPTPPGAVGSARSRCAPTTSASTAPAAPGSRWLVPRTTSSARRSLRTPAVRAARVWGRWCTRATDAFARRAPGTATPSARARPAPRPRCATASSDGRTATAAAAPGSSARRWLELEAARPVAGRDPAVEVAGLGARLRLRPGDASRTAPGTRRSVPSAWPGPRRTQPWRARARRWPR